MTNIAENKYRNPFYSERRPRQAHSSLPARGVRGGYSNWRGEGGRRLSMIIMYTTTVNRAVYCQYYRIFSLRQWGRAKQSCGSGHVVYRLTVTVVHDISMSSPLLPLEVPLDPAIHFDCLDPEI